MPEACSQAPNRQHSGPRDLRATALGVLPVGWEAPVQPQLLLRTRAGSRVGRRLGEMGLGSDSRGCGEVGGHAHRRGEPAASWSHHSRVPHLDPPLRTSRSWKAPPPFSLRIPNPRLGRIRRQDLPHGATWSLVTGIPRCRRRVSGEKCLKSEAGRWRVPGHVPAHWRPDSKTAL